MIPNLASECLRKMFLSCLLAVLISCLPAKKSQSSHITEALVIADLPGYPYVFEMNTGESHLIRTRLAGKQIERIITIKSVELVTEPNYWVADPHSRQTYLEARVSVTVSGTDTMLLHRPYQMPVTVNGLRIYVEAIKEWAENAELADLTDVRKQVRLAVCAADETWGPASFRFPIGNYRWRSSVYNNTWSSLVPYNLLYYHRGEDYGAIPDVLPVLAPFDGIIMQTPLPRGDGQSNAIFIRQENGITARISHMNTETLVPELGRGTNVKAGTQLAKTGMTWDGRKSQENDPHCHIELIKDSTKLASFPYLLEAYFRDYPDGILAIAGGYQYTIPGVPLVLDAHRSQARPGRKLRTWQWKLHNGQQINSPITTVTYTKPGLYTEELIVTNDLGEEDRDYVQVRVFDTSRGRNLAYGWAYHSPVRHIKPGMPVLFWNRLVHTTSAVYIDYGDGTPAEPIPQETTHAFARKGIYTITLSSTGPEGEPVTLKMDVHVE